MQLTALISHSIYYLTLKVELLTMLLKDIPHQKLKGSGWNTRGYLPHFDGFAIPQFITLNLVDAIPLKVIDRWKKELEHLNSKEEQILMQRRIDAYWIRDMEAVI